MRRKVIIISTKLFSLQPVGLRTEFVESQTSYISRLADAHCVSVGTLIGKEIIPILGKEYLKNSVKAGGSRLYNFAIEINGLGKQAANFANVLSGLTGIDNIRDLTLIHWGGVFPVKEMFRKSKAWCPYCFYNSKKDDQPIYEPLIWNFKAVNICRIHSVRLETQCPNCIKEIPFLSRKTRNGFCPFCGCWLGSGDAGTNQIKADGLLWENFVVANIGSLIMVGNELPVRFKDNSICTFINSIVDRAGGIGTFSRYVDIPESTIRLWTRGIKKPILNTLLKICFEVGINISEISGNKHTYINFIPTDKELKPVKVGKLVKNTERRKIDWTSIENSLKDVANKTFPAPSVCEVARTLGLNKRQLYSHFSALCKIIAKNHTSFIQMMKKKRIEEGCQKVSEAVVSLYNSGIYPSRRKVECFLSQNILLREKAYQIAWKKVLLNLDLLSK